MVADLVLRDIGLLVTMDGPELVHAWVAIQNGLVSALGTDTPPLARETLSAKGGLVTPGLINTHHHIFQNLTRAYAPATNATLFGWLTTLSPLWARLDEEAAYVSAWIGLAELALGGCTTTTDHLYIHPQPRLLDATIAAARDIGLRFHPVRGAVDITRQQHGPLASTTRQTHDEILEDWERLVATYHDPRPGALVRIALGPCSLFTASLELYRAAANVANRLGVRLHTHLAEDEDEIRFCHAKYSKHPVALLEDVGWNTPAAWIAHGIFLDARQIQLLADWGVGVAHCPSSNMLIARGTAPVTELRAAGVAVGLGCDGSASTDHASLWLEARTALLLARLRGGPTAMTARDALAIATRGSAACLGRADELGMIRAGAPADLVVWPTAGISFAGAHTDLVEAWLRCGPISAHHTIVHGRVIVRDGQLVHPETDEILRAHARISRALIAAAVQS